MSSFSDYLENRVLDHFFGGAASSAPATLYIAAFTVAPTDAGGGTEVAGSNYSRVAVTNNSTNFPNASGGTKSNGTAIVFPTPSGSWGTVVAAAIFDASTSGNMFAWDDFPGVSIGGASDILEIPAASLTLALT